MIRRLASLSLTALLTTSIAAAAQAPATHEVASDGSGDHASISAAIEAAAPGDTILISPGTYVENLYIAKPLTLTGDGSRDEIVILHDESAPQYTDMEPDGSSVVTIYVDGVDVTIEHLSVMDEDDRYTSILLEGGVSTIRNVHANDHVGIRGDAIATIEDSYVERLGLWGAPTYTIATGNEIHDHVIAGEGARGRLEGNVVLDRPIVIQSGASLEVVGNTIKPRPNEPGVIVIGPESTATITGNDVEGGFAGVILEFAGESVVEDNVLRHGDVGILALETPSVITGNTVVDASENGIVAGGNGMTVDANEVRGGRTGIYVHDSDGFPPETRLLDEPPAIVDNRVDTTYYALVIESSSPSVSGNELCGGREGLRLAGDSSPTLGSNEICAAEASS